MVLNLFVFDENGNEIDDLPEIAYHSRAVFDGVNEKEHISTPNTVSNIKVGRSEVDTNSLASILRQNAYDVNTVFDDISDGQDGWNIEIISIREIGDDSNELDDLIENNGTDETDENIGRIWQAVANDEIVQREIIGKETDLAFVEPLKNRFPNLSGEIYLVQQGNNTMKMPVELLQQTINNDQAQVNRKQADDEYTQQYANQKAEQEAVETAKKAKLTAFLNTITDSKVKGLAQKTLEKEINTHELGVTQRYLWIENLIENQFKPEMKEVSAVKEVSRTRYNRMSADEQAEYEKRLAEKKMAYFMTGVSGSYDVSKFEYEFAMFLTNSGSLNNDKPLETSTDAEPENSGNPNDEINNLARIAE